VNAQMRVRAQIQQEVERVAVDLGMPTRSEIDSIGERLQALRREVRQRGAETAGKGLAREVASLRSELAALKASIGKETRSAPERAAETKPRPQPKPKIEPRIESKAEPKAKVVAIEPTPARAAAKHGKPRKAKRKGSAKRAVAATSTFASRIAKFADASLGAGRPHALRKDKKKQAKADKAKKKR